MTTAWMEGFAGRVTNALEAKGMTQTQMAAQLGCYKETVWTWANGKYPPTSYNIIRIADVLDVSTDWLLGLSKTGGPKEKGGMAYDH